LSVTGQSIFYHWTKTNKKLSNINNILSDDDLILSNASRIHAVSRRALFSLLVPFSPFKSPPEGARSALRAWTPPGAEQPLSRQSPLGGGPNPSSSSKAQRRDRKGGGGWPFPISMGKPPAGSSKTQAGLGGSGIARNHKPGKRERARLVDVRLSLERVPRGPSSPPLGGSCALCMYAVLRGACGRTWGHGRGGAKPREGSAKRTDEARRSRALNLYMGHFATVCNYLAFLPAFFLSRF
jgi:hypothetical protein